MRAKIAKKLRRDALRKGAVIIQEGMTFTKQEMRKYNYTRKDNGYVVSVVYKNWKIHSCGHDMLDAYHSLLWMMDDDDFYETYKMEDV